MATEDKTISQTIKERVYSKEELEDIVKTCNDKVFKMEREERIEQLKAETKRLKREIEFPEEANNKEEFDYTHK